MRDNIRSIGETELNFLPLWMRTSQPGSIENLGYVKAVPLCYVKPGNSTTIINALNTADIKFNQFDFDIDRYVIDSTTGNSNEQYLLFHNYEYNV
jgi:phage-related protein